MRKLLTSMLARWAVNQTCGRLPDFVIGDARAPYLLRWWLFGRKPHPTDPGRFIARSFLGLRPYVHCFLRSDDDRALHDHPSASISIALHGSCVEHTIDAGGIHRRKVISAGAVRFRRASFAHRIEIQPGTEFWTLFIFGPNTREWGFHCPDRGWVHWKDFTNPETGGATVGRGCGEVAP
jgi:hypothetical protein